MRKLLLLPLLLLAGCASPTEPVCQLPVERPVVDVQGDTVGVMQITACGPITIEGAP